MVLKIITCGLLIILLPTLAGLNWLFGSKEFAEDLMYALWLGVHND